MSDSFEKRFDRLVDMLYVLQSPHGHTTTSLALRYRMDRRTIARDLEDLRRARFPVEYLGRGRGHRLDPQHRLPQNALTLREVVPLVLGASLSSSPHRQTALAKVRSFSANGMERAVVLNLPDRVTRPAHPGRGEEWLEALSGAIAKGQRVAVSYSSRRRILEPWSLLHQSMVWYLHAHDVEGGVERRFRLNRLQAVEVLAEPAQHPRPPSQAACFHPWDFGAGKACRVVVSLTPQLETWLRENPPHPSQELGDGRAAYVVRNQAHFFGWLLSLTDARLEEPRAWRDALRHRLGELLRLYE